MIGYPTDRQRSGHFARYAKAIFKAEAIEQFGHGPIMLALYVASIEDRLHYRKPPRIWRDELKSRLGIGANVTLIRYRKQAIEAGLIHFKEGDRVNSPVYWSIVPEWLQPYFAVQKVNAKTVCRSESEPQSEPQSEHQSERFLTLLPNNPIDSVRPKKTGTKFKPPAVEEIQAYCLERKNSVDPTEFRDYYVSNGWKVGRNAMKDWKATVRRWEKNDFAKNGKPTGTPYRDLTAKANSRNEIP